MQQMNRSIYAVSPGEAVTVEIMATKVGNFATLAVDGRLLNPVTASPLRFTFPVTGPVGAAHFGFVDCLFPRDSPSDARFDVLVSGSAGGGTFQGSDILKTDPLPHRRGIQFRVV